MSLLKSSYLVILSHASIAPADSTTYYFSANPNSISTTFGNYPVYIPSSGVIRKVTVAASMQNGKIGSSSENVGQYLRISGSDTTITTTASYAVSGNTTVVTTVTNLNVAVTAGQYLEFKIVTPAWATNPVALTHTVSVQIDSR